MADRIETEILNDELDRLFDVDALLAGIVAIAGCGSEVSRISNIAREQLELVRNNLDLIGIGRATEVQRG